MYPRQWKKAVDQFELFTQEHMDTPESVAQDYPGIVLGSVSIDLKTGKLIDPTPSSDTNKNPAR